MLRPRALAASVAALALTIVALPGQASAYVVNPYYDSFYSQPAGLAYVPNGTVLASRPVSLLASNQVALPLIAYEVKYRSQDSVGKPVADVTTVILPPTPAPGAPVLSYQVAEDSLGLQCAPSYALTTGSTTLSSSEEFLMMLALAQGWTLSVPDYEGPWSQYTAGRQAGHAVLDGVRAVENFAASGATATSRVGLWGYSGGGQATAWAGELEGTYAPELNVVGVAEGGVPADISAVMDAADGTPFAGLEIGAVTGLSRAYPSASLGSVLNATGRSVAGKLALLCNSDLLSTFAGMTMDSLTTVPNATSLPKFASVVNSNELGQYIPQAPVYNYHAIHDEFLPIAAADALSATYCSEGVTVMHVRIPTGDHIQALLSGATGALQWLGDRFAGRPATDNCPN